MSGQIGVDDHFTLTRTLGLYLKELFQVAFPDFFSKYEKAFDAGAFHLADPGPFLGRAIVWKLPVELHKDGLDDRPTIIFDCGSYTGGILYLPDLGLSLQ